MTETCRDFKAKDRRAVAWLTVAVVAGFFVQGQVITAHEDQVIRLVENNHPPISLLFLTFLLIACGCAFLVYPALRCALVPGRKTSWSAFRTPLAILAGGLWSTLPLTWTTSTIDDEVKMFTTRQTVLGREVKPKGGSVVFVTSWRGFQREKLSTVGRRLDGFNPVDAVDIELITNKAGMLNVTRVKKADEDDIREKAGGVKQQSAR